MEVSGQPQK